jgi:hypothetical protein
MLHLALPIYKRAVQAIGKIATVHKSLLKTALLAIGGMIVVVAILAQPSRQVPNHVAKLTLTTKPKHTVIPTPKVSHLQPKTTPAPVSTPAPPTVPAPTPTPIPTPTPKPTQTVIPAPHSSVSSLTPTPSSSSGSGSGGSSGSSGSGSNQNSPSPTSYTSENWSGYFATSATYTAISGSWIVPTVTGNGVDTSADGTWIGIGGVTTNDLIQVGTEDTVTAAGQVSTTAFYELLPNASQPINSITVSPGDVMVASLTEISANSWDITITDQTNNQSFTDTVSYSSSNSSAEWIEEDPSYTNGSLVPLDNFGTVSFSGGYTTIDDTSNSISNSDANEVIMVSNSGQTEATPSVVGSDGTSFSVTRDQ